MFRTLIVDDSEITGKVLIKQLGLFSKSELITSSNLALDSIQNAGRMGAPYRLICLDINMPEKSGVELLKEIRAYEKSKDVDPAIRVKILMTTASSEADIVREALTSGCDGYLLKPIVQLLLEKELTRIGLITPEEIKSLKK
jgi:two-component system chemotaxis response regulator CheY